MQKISTTTAKVKKERVIPELEAVLPFVRHLLNRNVAVQFADFKFVTRLASVRMTKLADFNNPPDKRERGDGFYTPKSVGLFFEGGEMIAIVVEDLIHPPTNSLNGVQFVFEKVTLTLGAA